MSSLGSIGANVEVVEAAGPVEDCAVDAEGLVVAALWEDCAGSGVVDDDTEVDVEDCVETMAGPVCAVECVAV